jgi:arsenite methyltransferase
MAHHSLHTHEHNEQKSESKHTPLKGLRLSIREKYMNFFHSNPIIVDYRSNGISPLSKHIIMVGIIGIIAAIIAWNIFSGALQTIVVTILTVIGSHSIAVVAIVSLLLLRKISKGRNKVRQMVIDTVQWRGDERVLDVACGSGMLLNGCAKKLTTGKAIGIDIWKATSGSGDYDMLQKNIKAEGVQDRVEFKSMDARKLQFEDNSFDVVVSSWALHHIGSDTTELGQAILEMIRVLKPDGTLTLVDVVPLMETAEAVMNNHGMVDIRREDAGSISSANFNMVTARKKH